MSTPYWDRARVAESQRGILPAPRNENVHSPRLPGGSLFAAANDRHLMGWSDRGGASRYMGDCWATRVASELEQAPGQVWPIPGTDRAGYTVRAIARLDDSEALMREVNRHQLENPDFVLVGVRDDGSPCLQSVDAKFAIDRIKKSQVSAEALTALLAIEDGVARSLITTAMQSVGIDTAEPINGLFIAPRSTFTDLLLRRLPGGRNPSGPPPPIVTIEPEPATLYLGTPPARLIGALARIDMLPVTPRENVLSAIYYLRLACACLWMAAEEHRPLFGGVRPYEAEPAQVAAEITRRSSVAESAWDLVTQWATDVEPVARSREAIASVATLPLAMRDIRTRVEAIGGEQANRLVRTVRRELDVVFRTHLTEAVGDIAADDPRPLGEILDMMASASRDLKLTMQEEFERLLLTHATIRAEHDTVE